MGGLFPPPGGSGATTGQITLALTGLTVAAQMVVDYTTIGGMVFALLHAAVNTSNATSFTATGLPAALTPARQQLIQLPFNSVEDNSVLVGAVATIMLAAASNVLTFNLNGNANGFTAANQKGLAIPVPIVWGLT